MPRVPVTEAVAVVEDLRDRYGLGRLSIADLSGLPEGTVNDFLYRKRDTRKSVCCHTLASLQSIQPPFDLTLLRPWSTLLSFPYARKVQALIALGYSLRHLGRELHTGQDTLRRVLSRPTITRQKAQRIDELYERLWDKPFSPTNSTENRVRWMTIATARSLGYAPPMCWCDEAIYQPEGRPSKWTNDVKVIK